MTRTGGANWEMGRWAERKMRAWLEAAGYYVVPTALVEDGGAPALTQELKRIVLPDLQAFRDGVGAWWEVKSKTKPDPYNKASGDLRHGIAKRLWLAYLRVEQETGLPGSLAIVEKRDRNVIAAPFERLRQYVHPHLGSHAAYGEEMVFFSRSDFDVLVRNAVWPDVPPSPPAKPPHPWEPETVPPPTRQPRLEFG